MKVKLNPKYKIKDKKISRSEIEYIENELDYIIHVVFRTKDPIGIMRTESATENIRGILRTVKSRSADD
jgi:uncharacterized protein (UPF0218 family)